MAHHDSSRPYTTYKEDRDRTLREMTRMIKTSNLKSPAIDYMLRSFKGSPAARLGLTSVWGYIMSSQLEHENYRGLVAAAKGGALGIVVRFVVRCSRAPDRFWTDNEFCRDLGSAFIGISQLIGTANNYGLSRGKDSVFETMWKEIRRLQDDIVEAFDVSITRLAPTKDVSLAASVMFLTKSGDIMFHALILDHVTSIESPSIATLCRCVAFYTDYYHKLLRKKVQTTPGNHDSNELEQAITNLLRRLWTWSTTSSIKSLDEANEIPSYFYSCYPALFDYFATELEKVGQVPTFPCYLGILAIDLVSRPECKVEHIKLFFQPRLFRKLLAAFRDLDSSEPKSGSNIQEFKTMFVEQGIGHLLYQLLCRSPDAAGEAIKGVGSDLIASLKGWSVEQNTSTASQQTRRALSTLFRVHLAGGRAPTMEFAKMFAITSANALPGHGVDGTHLKFWEEGAKVAKRLSGTSVGEEKDYNHLCRILVEVLEPATFEVVDLTDDVDRICLTCHKSDGQLFICTTCRCAVYCSGECQKVDWKGHRPVCKLAKSARARCNS